MNTLPQRKTRRQSGMIAALALTMAAGLLLSSPGAGSYAQQEPNRQLVQKNAPRENNVRRIALVIGNGAYTNAPPLKNPPNDARDMAVNLKTLGFDVSSGVNVSQREMKRLIREFGQKLKAGGNGLFYYAGHGVQARGRNYIIPVDADIQSEADVEDSGVDVGLVLNYMDDAQNGLNIVILDACRNNPFSRSFRSASEGLAQVDAPTGTLIAYATAPGRVAADGVGENGLYTSELLKAMRLPGLTATDMFMQVRAEVMKKTGNKQVPWEASSLVGSFYFSGNPTDSNSNAANEIVSNQPKFDAAAFEYNYWDSIKSSTNADDFKAYLEKYPSGQFAALAKNRVKVLEVSKSVDMAPKSGTDAATELAFWDVVKTSTNADDFRAYLKKFPNGTFSDLANNRLKALEKGEEATRKADEIAKNTKSFKGSLVGYVIDMKFVISTGKIEILLKNGEREGPLQCSAFEQAALDKSDIYPIMWENEMWNNKKYRFRSESVADAASALDAIREACKPSVQVTPADSSGRDSLEGTTWRGTSPGHDKQYEFQFLPGGVYRGQTIVGKYTFKDSGTWKHVGNTVLIDSVVEGFPDTYHTEAIIEQDTMKGSSMGGKYKFIMRKIQ